MKQFWLNILTNFLGGGVIATTIMFFVIRRLKRKAGRYQEKTKLCFAVVTLYGVRQGKVRKRA